jgi:hypothetical protein
MFGTQLAIEIMTMLMGNVILEGEITKLGFNLKMLQDKSKNIEVGELRE